MKKQKYNISMKEGGESEVEGYVIGDWGIDKRGSSYYVLTYLPNGCLVESARTLSLLKLMIQEPEFFDFDGTKDGVRKLAGAITRFRSENGWK